MNCTAASLAFSIPSFSSSLLDATQIAKILYTSRLAKRNFSLVPRLLVVNAMKRNLTNVAGDRVRGGGQRSYSSRKGGRQRLFILLLVTTAVTVAPRTKYNSKEPHTHQIVRAYEAKRWAARRGMAQP